ncbi:MULTISPECIES: helix-turn-helix domain-containing protein [Bifidobacterium]|uniref:helix-turn-helix domain-containing protein n=1 Tax=Bifidobacterium TaxID=1678 RepID=UPI001BDDC1A5|nr:MULTISPECIES: TetR/AcrR family transcriptional regulator [Bifidobacterium]MBT1162296.1 TetR/AcrR family transcriptional regulator [Bifidobacterium sp. SO1]MBW3078853.1 TetR/AcrR family transcriptional regulator [Bifidobacterium simiiventris]
MEENIAPKRTRRRGEALETAILDAAWEQLSTCGAEEFTFDNVAARAHTSKPVLYRRWANRTDLFVAAVRWHRGRAALEQPDTGTLRGDVISILLQLNRKQSDAVMVLAKFGVYADWLGVSAHELYERTMMSDRPSIMMAIDAARERGGITCELPESLLRMPGELGRAIILRDMRPLSEADIVATVDELFLPLVDYYERRARAGAGGGAPTDTAR